MREFGSKEDELPEELPVFGGPWFALDIIWLLRELGSNEDAAPDDPPVWEPDVPPLGDATLPVPLMDEDAI